MFVIHRSLLLADSPQGPPSLLLQRDSQANIVGATFRPTLPAPPHSDQRIVTPMHFRTEWTQEEAARLSFLLAPSIHTASASKYTWLTSVNVLARLLAIQSHL